MPTRIDEPVVLQAAGNKPKRIEEYAGRVRSGHAHVSVARMISPEGWREPGQRPEFEEITVVLRGLVRVEHESGVIDARAGQARQGVAAVEARHKHLIERNVFNQGQEWAVHAGRKAGGQRKQFALPSVERQAA